MSKDDPLGMKAARQFLDAEVPEATAEELRLHQTLQWQEDELSKLRAEVARLQQERDQVRDALDEVRVESRDEIWYFSPNEAEAFMRRVSRWWVGFVLSVVPRR